MTYTRKKNKKKFGIVKKKHYICTRFSLKLTSRCTKVDNPVIFVNFVRES